MNKLFALATNLLLLTSTIILLFAIGELTVRIFYPIPPGITQYMVTADDDLCYRWTPNFNNTIHGTEFTQQLTINTDGFRDEQYVRLNNKTIIMSVGDSMTVATQIPLEQTFTKLLQKKLGNNYFVMNNGVIGYNPSQYYTLIKQHLAQYKPSLILLNFFVGNDFIQSHQDYRKNSCTVTVVDGYEVSTQYKHKGIIFRIRLFFARYSQFYNVITDLINKNYWLKNKLYDFGFTVSPPYREDLLAYDRTSKQATDIHTTTFTIIKEINNLTKNNHATLIVIIIPGPEHINPRLWNNLIQNFNLNQTIDFNYAYDHLEQFLAREKIPFLNLLEAETNTNDIIYLKKDGHFTLQGHQLVAEEIYTFLIMNHLLRP